MNLSNDLHALADRLARLAPSHRDPFHFHEEKSELVHELHVLAIKAVALPPPTTTSRALPKAATRACATNVESGSPAPSIHGGVSSASLNRSQKGSSLEFPDN
ncbi:hypothetical protein [Agrobacterium fabrum]|uniref:hypothetical protein n=1 Tax=Agrobacterium fabrum TaxID=1176649 RepID=UPI000F0C6DCA|nr:hypothetical protein [Agrobacterium fabrum]AYM56737.1 hypothetical protein At1D132_07200 [Agrobacterium fabrum]NSZ11106.1 hypothetical protein [Agrobacterium fabrum]